jgi:hypothetical protein
LGEVGFKGIGIVVVQEKRGGELSECWVPGEIPPDPPGQRREFSTLTLTLSLKGEGIIRKAGGGARSTFFGD